MKIPNIQDYLTEYVVIENLSNNDETFMLQKGIRFKVSVIKASLVTYKITSPLNDCMDVIKKWALELKDRANDDISNLQHSLDLWNNSPTMFKSKRSVLKADKLIKAGSNKNLVEAIRQERLKGAGMYASLIEGGGPVVDTDIPHFKPFNKRLPSCPPDEFERQLRMLQRNYPRFEGRCAEFIYFLMDIEAMKKSFNITNEQLAHILQNRLGGRLQKYFMIQMKRNGDVVTVLNRLSKDYVETIDTAAEVEKCATFKFQFKNIVDELIKLKEMVALAYPNSTDDEFRQIYIQKVTDKVPPDVRFALTEDFQRQRQRVNLGMPPLTDNEVDAQIVKHCKPLEKRCNKPVFQVESKSYPSYEDSVASEDSVSMVGNNIGPEESFLKGFVRSVQQIAASAALANENKSLPQNTYPYNNKYDRSQILLAEPSDSQYCALVEEIKSNDNVRYLGQKIRNDFRNIRNENFKQSLQQLHSPEAGLNPIYEIVDGYYKVDDCPMISGPIFKKVENYPPQLTADALRGFSERCYSCGFENCPKKGNPQKTKFRCIYESKPDSWWPCEKCMRGFHLAKDCLALLKN